LKKSKDQLVLSPSFMSLSPFIYQTQTPLGPIYGNELIIGFNEIVQKPNSLTLLVRVIHKVDIGKNPTPTDIDKIFSYYTRYYPWLHVRIDNCKGSVNLRRYFLVVLICKLIQPVPYMI
jgi:hypothetical protein